MTASSSCRAMVEMVVFAALVLDLAILEIFEPGGDRTTATQPLLQDAFSALPPGSALAAHAGFWSDLARLIAQPALDGSDHGYSDAPCGERVGSPAEWHPAVLDRDVIRPDPDVRRVFDDVRAEVNCRRGMTRPETGSR